MIGWHLRQVQRLHTAGWQVTQTRVWRDHITRLDKGPEAISGPDFRQAKFNEFINISLIIRKQNEPLKMLRSGAGIMGETQQRIVYPRGREHRQRL